MKLITKKQAFVGGFLAVLTLLTLCHAPSALAQGANPANIMPAGLDATIGNLVAKLISVLNILTWIIFVFLNYLLDPNFIFDIDGNGDFVGMLNEIWQFSRDLVNLCFAFALVFVAVYTVVTQDKQLVQSNIKKFVLAVILVNFSWFIPRVILDVANVSTSFVYGIPSLIAGNAQNAGNAAVCRTIEGPTNRNPRCTPIDGDPNGLQYCPCQAVVNARLFLEPNEAQNLHGTANQTGRWECMGSIICLKYADLDMSTIAGHSAILNGLIVNHARLRTLAIVPRAANVGTPSGMVMFLIREMMILLMHIALLFPLIGITIAFAIRIPVLWFTMAFMPFFVLGKLASGKLQFIGQETEKLGDHFLKAAFLPAMVAVPFSIGFIMVNAGSQIQGTAINGLLNTQIRLLDNVSSLYQLIWLGMSFGVIWVGVFAVLEKSSLMGFSGRGLKKFGEEVGALGLKIPTALPIIPGKQTPLHLFNMMKEAPRGVGHNLNNMSLSDAVANYQHGNTEANRDKFAKKTAGNEQLTKEFKETMEKVADALQHNRTDEANRIIKELNRTNHLGLNQDARNIHTDFDALITRMKNAGGTTTDLVEQNRRIKQYNGATAPAAGTPGAAVPAPAAPAPAAGGGPGAGAAPGAAPGAGAGGPP